MFAVWQRTEGGRRNVRGGFCSSALQLIPLALFGDACVCARLLIHLMSSPRFTHLISHYFVFCVLLPIAEHGSALFSHAHARSLPSSPIIFNRACLLVWERACLPLSLSDWSRILVELLLSACTNVKRLLWAARHPCVCGETRPGTQQSKSRRSFPVSKCSERSGGDMGWCLRALGLGPWVWRGGF